MFMHLNSFNGFVLPLGNYGAYSNALVFYVGITISIYIYLDIQI